MDSVSSRFYSFLSMAILVHYYSQSHQHNSFDRAESTQRVREDRTSENNNPTEIMLKAAAGGGRE